MNERNFSDECVALIPARGGSKGVPRKNIRFLGGFPLLTYSIAAAHQSKSINRVIVSTDDEEIAEIAMQYGAEVPFMRPTELAADASGDLEWVSHAVNWLLEHEGGVPRYIAQLRPTTPLRNPVVIDDAIEQFRAAKNMTSMRSAHEASESPYKWFLLNKEEGMFHSLSSEIDNEQSNAGRQTFPTVYVPDGYIDVLDAEYIVREGKLLGPRMMGYVSPFCMEIDTEDDIDLLECYLERHGSILRDYLRNKYRKIQEVQSKNVRIQHDTASGA